MLSENEGWAVGTTGRIIKYDGKTWSPVESTVDTELLAVHFLAPDFGFATGKILPSYFLMDSRGPLKIRD